MMHDQQISRLLMSLPVGSRPGVIVAGRVSGQEFTLNARKTPRGARNLDGELGNQVLEGRVEETNGLRRATGFGIGGEYDLTSRPCEGGREAEGWVGNRGIQLTSKSWGATVKIEGRVGCDRVVLTQWNQFDGHMLSGYIGNRNISVQTRNSPGEPPLEPMDYLPLLMNPQPEYPVKTFSVSGGIDVLG